MDSRKTCISHNKLFTRESLYGKKQKNQYFSYKLYQMKNFMVLLYLYHNSYKTINPFLVTFLMLFYGLFYVKGTPLDLLICSHFHL